MVYFSLNLENVKHYIFNKNDKQITDVYIKNMVKNVNFLHIIP
jgi:hypothetical protein